MFTFCVFFGMLFYMTDDTPPCKSEDETDFSYITISYDGIGKPDFDIKCRNINEKVILARFITGKLNELNNEIDMAFGFSIPTAISA